MDWLKMISLKLLLLSTILIVLGCSSTSQTITEKDITLLEIGDALEDKTEVICMSKTDYLEVFKARLEM